MWFRTPTSLNPNIVNLEESLLNIQGASQDQLKSWDIELAEAYEHIQAKNLSLDLTRGKPSAEQLSLSNALDGILEGNYITKSGVDVRNYGGIDGLEEARELGSGVLGLPMSQVLAGGSSSLTLMHQAMTIAHCDGLTGPESAWNNNDKVSVICPVPGYDRHYSICDHLGINMLNVPMGPTGPDMDAVETLIENDTSIRGMWCVPKYSNPTGVIYSQQTVERIAKLGKTGHPDFRVFWDNAYAIHDLYEEAELTNIYDECAKAGTEDSVLQFASTSKVTFAGAGISFFGASDNNLAGFKRSLGHITIGPDKVNQLRHVKFFATPGSLKAHMKKHAAILKPRFRSVLTHLNDAFSGKGLGSWESADGGYFISFDTLPGLAKEIVRLAGEAGVKLTPAGATFPYGKDPNDSNIRIAPSVPSVEQVGEAMEVFILCVKLASVRKFLTDAAA